MRLIRSLVFPWILFFVVAVAALVYLGVKPVSLPQLQGKTQYLPYAVLALGSLLALMANLRSLESVGIWMSEALPESLRYGGSFTWFFRAVKAGLVAAAFWFVGQLPWIPLVWQVAVIPVVFTFALFIAVWSMLGPILKLTSNLAWSRGFGFILSLPVLAMVPATAWLVGDTAVHAYRASRPDVTLQVAAARSIAVETDEENAASSAKPEAETRVKTPSTKPDSRADGFRKAALAGKPCPELTKDVQLALMEPRGSKETVYWAARAIQCAEVRAVVAMPRLVQVMLEHPDALTRAASINAMKKYGHANVRQISYLLVKRLSAGEPPEVVEAAAGALAPLGAEEQRIGSKRLAALLEDKRVSSFAALSLVRDFKRDDLVAEHVAQGLESTDATAKERAVGMICTLPKSRRSVADGKINEVIAMIKSADSDDAGVKAIDCMGASGIKAIREQVANPTRLDRELAAHVLAELDPKEDPQAIETASSCSHDGNKEIRKWCSQTLGELGAPALPKIVELLKSSDPGLKEAGQNALNFFDDAGAKDDLRKILADNSGWMANNKKLQIAKAVGTALVRIETRGNE